ncbi:MAG: DMT family transporter [Pseudomonadota bacterium]|nr:DMT family transporter [Pseudomonadota bacterium]
MTESAIEAALDRQGKPQNGNLSASGYVLVFLVIIGWGTSWPFLKIALSEIPPWTFRGLIAPTAAIFTFAIAIFMKQSIRIPRHQWRVMLFASALNITIWHILSAMAIRLMGSGQAAIIAYTMPLWASLLSMVFIGEQPTRRRILGLFSGLTGLAVLVSGELGVFAAAPLGTIFMLLAALSWGAGTVVQKRVHWEMPAAAVAGWQLLIGGFPVSIVALIVEAPHLQPVSAAAAWSTVFVLVYPIIFCWFAWFAIIRQVPVMVSTVSIMLVPVLGVIFGNLVLNEPIGWREVVSLTLVCGALGLVLTPPKPAA